MLDRLDKTDDSNGEIFNCNVTAYAGRETTLYTLYAWCMCEQCIMKLVFDLV